MRNLVADQDLALDRLRKKPVRSHVLQRQAGAIGQPGPELPDVGALLASHAVEGTPGIASESVPGSPDGQVDWMLCSNPFSTRLRSD